MGNGSVRDVGDGACARALLFRTRAVPIQLRQSLVRSVDPPTNQIRLVPHASNDVFMFVFSFSFFKERETANPSSLNCAVHEKL